MKTLFVVISASVEDDQIDDFVNVIKTELNSICWKEPFGVDVSRQPPKYGSLWQQLKRWWKS